MNHAYFIFILLKFGSIVAILCIISIFLIKTKFKLLRIPLALIIGLFVVSLSEELDLITDKSSEYTYSDAYIREIFPKEPKKIELTEDKDQLIHVLRYEAKTNDEYYVMTVRKYSSVLEAVAVYENELSRREKLRNIEIKDYISSDGHTALIISYTNVPRGYNTLMRNLRRIIARFYYVEQLIYVVDNYEYTISRYYMDAQDGDKLPSQFLIKIN